MGIKYLVFGSSFRSVDEPKQRVGGIGGDFCYSPERLGPDNFSEITLQRLRLAGKKLTELHSSVSDTHNRPMKLSLRRYVVGVLYCYL